MDVYDQGKPTIIDQRLHNFQLPAATSLVHIWLKLDQISGWFFFHFILKVLVNAKHGS